MLTDSSRFLLALAGVAFASLVTFAMMSGDHTGITLLVALGAVAAAVAVVLATNRDVQPVSVGAAGGDADPAVLTPVVAPRAVGGGSWPFMAAVAAGLTGLSLVSGPWVAGAAASTGLVVLVGWLAAVSAERTGRTINLLPVAVPVLGFAFIASLMYLMSRILLAVSEFAAVWVALGVAVLILAAASVFALKPKISTRGMMVGLALGSVLMLGGGLVAAAVGERHIEVHGAEGGHAAGSVEIAAENISFDTEEIDLHAGEEVAISFDNRDALPHNVSIYATEAAVEKIFVGEIITGPKATTYHFTAPGPGTYFFRCDVHPTMRGTVKVA